MSQLRVLLLLAATILLLLPATAQEPSAPEPAVAEETAAGSPTPEQPAEAGSADAAPSLADSRETASREDDTSEISLYEAETKDDEAPGPDDLEIFVDTVDVQVVNVDVYVTDKDGNRVTGLTKDDFELYEDRRPVTITNFYAVEGGRPTAGPQVAETVEPLDLPPVPLPEHLAVEEDVPAEQRLFLVVYIDNFNIRPYNRNRVMGELSYFLSTELDRGDQVMLVTYDRSLNVRRPFTADPDLIARALEEIERLTGHAVSRDDERRQAMDRIGEVNSQGQALAFARMHAESVQNDLKFSLGALKDMVGQLGGLPGRKAILYVSDGVPMVPGQDLFYAVQGKFGGNTITDSFHYDASRDFDQLASLANANRVSFYTIDAVGLRLASSFAAENANPSLGLQVDSTYNSNHQSPLRYLAEETGGKAIINTNRILPGLKSVAEDFDTYYSLGYTPPRAGTGRYHDIRVEVKGRKGLVVRHRQGYRDKTIEARMNDGTLSALSFGFRDNPLGARLTFGPAQPRDRRFYVVPVQVEIPLGELVMVPHQDSHEARVRLYVAARDEQGDTSAVQQVSVPISIPDADVERARGQSYRYTVPLMMRGGLQQVAVGVRDEIASRESFVLENVQVGPRSQEGGRGR